MSPPVSQANEVFSPAAEEEAKEEEEETANLSSILEELGLSEYLSTFEQEKIDVESLVSRKLSLVICAFIHFLCQLILSFSLSFCLSFSAAYVYSG